MTKKEFMNRIGNGKVDILQQFIGLLKKLKIDYCVIGGLAVNSYVEPVVSLDLDIIVITDDLDRLIRSSGKIFKKKRFAHSINLTSSKSDLRIQIQTDPRYQPFIKKSSVKNVMGYRMKAASLEDVLQGKVWAYSDKKRRPSKRQKDIADILRLTESYPKLKSSLPESIKKLAK
ncbi:MAG: hypothetical protein ABH843_06680 [Candidatus Omnitrophota bacterium]